MSVEIINNTMWLASFLQNNDDNQAEKSKEISRKEVLEILAKEKKKPSIPVSWDEKKWLLVDVVI